MAKTTAPTASDKPLQSSGTKTVMQTLTVRPARIETADISTWSNAINSYKNGSRTAWFNLCDNLMSDGVLADAIDKLVEEVTGAEIAFQIDGKTVDIINDLMDTPEFEELMKEIALSKVYGRSVIECGFAPAFSVYSYPRKNCIIRNMDKPLSERIKFIAAKEGDTTGYDYSKDEFIFEIGKDEDLGLIFRAAQYVIYKRGNFGDWAQFAEIFGMPFLLGKYNSTDTNARDQLFEALSQIGGKPVAAVPNEASVEVVQNSSTGSSALYKDLKDACNEEILIAIQGETMTTLSGSSLSQSKVHQETNTKKGKALKRFVQRMLNKHLVPLLIKRGYPVVGGKFVFPKSATDITVDELATLSDIIDIPAEYVHNKYGVPMAKEGEKLAKKAQPAVTAPLPPNFPDDEQDNENDTKEPPTPKGKKKKEVKLSDADGFWKGFFDFFAVARTTRSRANLSLADKSTNYTAATNIDKLFENALKDIYKQYGVDPKDMPIVNKSLFDISNKALQKGIDNSFSVEFGKTNADFINQFKTNASVFSAFKSHAQGKEIVAQLIDEKGDLRSYDKFRKSVLGTSIKADYNENWLKTEYNMAVRSARMAEKLKGYERTLHLYPNLKFVESTAAEKRAAHLQWVGTILPFGHKWFETHTPPVEWGCECSLENTDEPVTGVPDGGDDVNPVFANNPAKTAEFINLKEHPMVKAVTDEEVAQSIIEFAKLNVDDEWQVVKTKNGILRVSSGHGKGERTENIELAKYFSNKYGYDIDLIATNNRKKTADSLNKTLGIEQEYKHNKKATISAIDNELRDAKKQSDHIVLNIKSKIKTGDLVNALKDRVRRAENIQSVWIKIGKFDKQYTRKEILSPGFKIQRD